MMTSVWKRHNWGEICCVQSSVKLWVKQKRLIGWFFSSSFSMKTRTFNYLVASLERIERILLHITRLKWELCSRTEIIWKSIKVGKINIPGGCQIDTATSLKVLGFKLLKSGKPPGEVSMLLYFSIGFCCCHNCRHILEQRNFWFDPA